MIKRLILISVFLFMISIDCSSFADEAIVIEGTSDSQDILQRLSFEFMRSNPGVKIIIPESIGSGGGIKAVYEGKCGLGRIARPVREEEKKYNLNYICFANSPVTFAVNFSGKGIDNITFKQIVGIYSGKITLWSQIGGAKKKIYVANNAPGDSVRTVLENNIPGFKNIEPFAGKILGSTKETAEILRKYKDTLGYVPLSISKESHFNVLKVNGIYPSVENVISKKYVLISPFGIVWKGELEGKNRKFVDFLFSPAAQKIMIEYGTIPVNR